MGHRQEKRAKGFLGASLALDFDYPRIAAEVGGCEDCFVDTPPYQRHVDDALSRAIPFRSESIERYRSIDTMVGREIRRRALRGVRIFYLRNSAASDVVVQPSFTVTKDLAHDSWYWRPELRTRIPYTIECIESLPYRTLGLIRVFVCDGTFMPTHRDTNAETDPGYDRSKAVGLSLIPETGNVGMLLWNPARKRVHRLEGHCLLFDDSNWHGVPMTRGRRITIRIFGELDTCPLEPHFTDAYYA